MQNSKPSELKLTEDKHGAGLELWSYISPAPGSRRVYDRPFRILLTGNCFEVWRDLPAEELEAMRDWCSEALTALAKTKSAR